MRGKSETRELKIIIHSCSVRPESVFLNGRLLKRKKRNGGDYTWEKENKILTINLIWKNQDLDLRIEK